MKKKSNQQINHFGSFSTSPFTQLSRSDAKLQQPPSGTTLTLDQLTERLNKLDPSFGKPKSVFSIRSRLNSEAQNDLLHLESLLKSMFTIRSTTQGTHGKHSNNRLPLLTREEQIIFPKSDSSIRSNLPKRILANSLLLLGQPFLPANFATTTTRPRDYLFYTYKTFNSNILGSITAVLAMQALLLAVGVTAAQATPIAAAITWILKDLLGNVGGSLLAARVARIFEFQPRLGRMISSIIYSFASFLELLSPFFGGSLLLLGAIATLLKNVSWILTAASRATTHLAFAGPSHLGQITAKSGAQATAAGVIGTSIGAAISWWCPISTSTAPSVAVLIIFSILSTYQLARALDHVHIDRFDFQRLSIFLNCLFMSLQPSKDSIPQFTNKSGLTAEAITPLESIWMWYTPPNSSSVTINIGSGSTTPFFHNIRLTRSSSLHSTSISPLHSLGTTAEEIHNNIVNSVEYPYYIGVLQGDDQDDSKWGKRSKPHSTIQLQWKPNTTPSDQVLGVTHALLLKQLLLQRNRLPLSNMGGPELHMYKFALDFATYNPVESASTSQLVRSAGQMLYATAFSGDNETNIANLILDQISMNGWNVSEPMDTTTPIDINFTI